MKVNLKAAEMERLALLAEEAGDVSRLIGKIMREGYDAEHGQELDCTNREYLQKKLADMKCAINVLCKSNDIDPDYIIEQSDRRTHMLGVLLSRQGGAA